MHIGVTLRIPAILAQQWGPPAVMRHALIGLGLWPPCEVLTHRWSLDPVTKDTLVELEVALPTSVTPGERSPA